MPAWLEDNVRRGAELVGGQGGVAPDFVFATLYRVHNWQSGSMKQTFPGKKTIGAKETLTPIFGIK